MLQYVAVCCSMLQCVAVCCSVLQCVAVRCSVLQCDKVCVGVRYRYIKLRLLSRGVFLFGIREKWVLYVFVRAYVCSVCLRVHVFERMFVFIYTCIYR